MAAVAKILVEIDDQGLVVGQQKVQEALAKTGTRGGVVFTELRGQQLRAQQASQLLSRTLGVQIPRALESVLAKSRLVGPALASAFNVAVAVGLAFALVSLIPKIKGLTEAIVGFGEAAKKVMEDAREENRRLLVSFDDLIEGMFKLHVIQGEFVKAQIEAREAAQRHDRSLTALIVSLLALPPAVIPAAIATFILARRMDEAQGKQEQWRQTLDEMNQALEAFRSKLQVTNTSINTAQGSFETATDAINAMVAETLKLPGSLAHFEALVEITEFWARAAKEAAFQLGEMMRAIEPDPGIADRVLREQQNRVQGLERILGLEADAAAERARLEGRTVDAIIIETERRVREVEEELRRLGLTEEEIARGVEAVWKEANTRIEEENRRKVEEIAGHWDRFIDQAVFGAQSWKDFFKGMLREMLATFLKFIGRMIIAWITGLEKMKDIWEAFKKSLPGGGGNLGSVIIQNFFPRFAHGGLVDDVLRRAQAIHSSDGRVLAMLHQGEAVLNPRATRLMGASRIDALNRAGGGSGRAEFSGGVRSFQGGGLVGPAPPAGSPTINIGPVNIIAGPNADGRQLFEQFAREARRRAGDKGVTLPF